MKRKLINPENKFSFKTTWVDEKSAVMVSNDYFYFKLFSGGSKNMHTVTLMKTAVLTPDLLQLNYQLCSAKYLSIKQMMWQNLWHKTYSMLLISLPSIFLISLYCQYALFDDSIRNDNKYVLHFLILTFVLQ